MNTALKQFLESQNSNNEYDKQLLIQLYNDTDDHTVLQILARFHETLGECIQNVEKALESGENTDAVWKSAHKIAGTAGLVGFASFGNFARELSHDLKSAPATAKSDEEIRKFLKLIRTNKEVISTAFPNYKDYLL